MIYEIDRLTHIDVKKLIEGGFDKVIIPVGTIEPHGPHLPLGTDTMIPYEIAKDIAKDIKSLIAPSIPYGVVTSLYGYNGAITIKRETLQRLVREVILSLKGYGFKVFIVLNGHGGNVEPLDSLLRILWVDHHVKSILVHWWIYVRELTKTILGESGAHAGIDETAMILVKYPELIKNKDKIANEAFLYEEGLRAYPFPGTIMLHGKNEGMPAFDAGKAKEYWDKVKNTIKEKILEITSRFTEFDII